MSAAPCDAGTSQHVGWNAEFSPGGVLNSLALSVVGSVDDKAIFDRGHIGFDLQCFDRRLDIPSLLHQEQTLDRLCVGNLGIDCVFLGVQRLCTLPAAGTRPVGFERFEIIPHCCGLDATCGNSRFVFVGHCSFAHDVCIARRFPVSNELGLM